MIADVIDLLFPPRCFACGLHLLLEERPARVCTSCAHTVFDLCSPSCPVCATPRDTNAGVDSACVSCLTSPPAFSRVHARWIYDGAVSDAIRRSKVSGDPASLFSLIDSDRGWFRDLARGTQAWSWTTPPVHARDLVARGWEPARTALRRAVGGEAVVRDVLVRGRRATKQAHLNRANRAAAMAGAFDCASPIAGRWVVFDDVMTTGSTLNEAARALRKAGATDVIGVVIARSV